MTDKQTRDAYKSDDALWSSNGGQFIAPELLIPTPRIKWRRWILALFFIVAMILLLPWAKV